MAVELINTTLFNDANLIHYYRFEGNSNDSKGTVNGVDTSMGYGTITGFFGQGGSFNGSSSQIAIDSAVIGSNSAYTVLGFFNGTSTQDGAVYGEGRSSTDSPFMMFRVNTGGTSGAVQYQTRDDGDILSTIDYSPGAGVLNNGSAHMYTIVKNSATSRILYIDGTAVGTNTTNLSNPTTLDKVRFGNLSRIGTVLFYLGRADDTATFNRALSATEILNHWTGADIISGGVASYKSLLGVGQA